MAGEEDAPPNTFAFLKASITCKHNFSNIS